MAVRYFTIEEFNLFYREKGGPKMGFDHKFQDVGLILQNLMFSFGLFFWYHFTTGLQTGR